MIERYKTPLRELWDPAWTTKVYKEIQVVNARWTPDVPDHVAEVMGRTPAPPTDLWAAEESIVRHDVAAWVNIFARTMGEINGRWVHYGLTSSDLVDTANAIRYRDAGEIIVATAQALAQELIDQVEDYTDTVRIGRTHGQDAEATTWGHQLSVYAGQLERSVFRSSQLLRELAMGKLSGAVGMNPVSTPHREVEALADLGLYRANSTQVVPRDALTRAVAEFAVMAGVIENLATEVRLGAQSSIAEFRENWADEQVGSSAMPHKRNPIIAERLCGLARMQRSYVGPVLETAGQLWGDRDISNSSVERMAVPDAFCNIHYMLVQAHDLISRLFVDEQAMRANLEKAWPDSQSGALLRALTRHTSLSRQECYSLSRKSVAVVQNHALTLPQAVYAVAAEDHYLAAYDNLVDQLLQVMSDLGEEIDTEDVPYGRDDEEG